MRFTFIDRHRGEWPVELMSEVLEVSRSGFYAWSKRPMSERKQRQEDLIQRIALVHEQSRGTYGSPRVCAELKDQGVCVCENTVAKLMRQARIKARIKRRFVPRTTDAKHPNPIAPNRLNRDFEATAPDRKWTCDITYVPTDAGWLYLAVVMDLYSRKIVGWSMRDHLRVELISEALKMAIASRRPAAGKLLHHSDRGVQYTCDAYQRLLAEHHIECSMSGCGNCYDNAVTESFFGTLKTELVHDEHYLTQEQARQSLFKWIECWYNRQRRHSSLGYQSPEAFEARLN